jgi:hypothetical protein
MLLLDTPQNFTNMLCSIFQICHSHLVTSILALE